MWRRVIVKSSSPLSAASVHTARYGTHAAVLKRTLNRQVQQRRTIQSSSSSSSRKPPVRNIANLPSRKDTNKGRSGRENSNKHLGNQQRKKSTDITSSESTTTTDIEPLTKSQIYSIFWQAAIPMIGFGFMDQTVMLQAGNAIDCSIGVTFGLSTLTAAALGQVCSDASGVIFGGTVERFFTYMKITKPLNLTALQHTLPIVSRTRFFGTLVGVILGCSLGLLNLLFIDTSRSSTLKLQAYADGEDGSDGLGLASFEIEASNDMHDTATALIVKGPDVDGLLASMTATLALQGCSIVEIHASKATTSSSSDADSTGDDSSTDKEGSDNQGINRGNGIHDTIYVVKQGTYEKYEDEELEELAQAVLDSTKLAPSMEHNIHMINNTVQTKLKELETTNEYLKARIKQLEEGN